MRHVPDNARQRWPASRQFGRLRDSGPDIRLVFPSSPSVASTRRLQSRALGIDPDMQILNHLNQPRELVKGKPVADLWA
jgi:hypothetical protein